METSDDEILERLRKNSTSSNKSRMPKIGRNNSRPSFMKSRGPIGPVQLTSEDLGHHGCDDEGRQRTLAEHPTDGNQSRASSTGRAQRRPSGLEALGAIRQRAGLGHRARRLQRQWRLVELLSPRSRPQPRLSLERRRHRRLLRRQAAYLPGGCAVERKRSDSQRADVRPEQSSRATTARTSKSITSSSTARPRTPT